MPDSPQPARSRQVLIAGIVVVVIGGVAYFASAPFRSTVDRHIEQATQWTPENIQRDPEGYLYHARGRVRETRNSLEASLISISQRRERAQQHLIESSSERDELSSVIDEMRRGYISARDVDAWPAQVDDQFFSEGDLRRNILRADTRYQAASETSDQLSSLLGQLDDREEMIRGKIRDLNAAERRIETSLETVRASATIKSVREIQIDMAAIDGARLAVAELPKDPVDLLMESRRERSDDRVFEEILERGR